MKQAAVVVENCGYFEYPTQAPFSPAETYPEYPYADGALQPDNWVYAYVRDALRRLNLDVERFGTADWNPLGGCIPRGGRVVLKPNLVISEHELGTPGLIASVAHGSVIRALADYAFIACGTSGRITICDAPIKEVDFAKITEVTGVVGVVEYLQGLGARGPKIELLDIRDLQAFRNEQGTIVGWTPLPGDQRGYTVVDLGRESMLAELGELTERLRSTAAVYEDEASKNHSPDVNRYSFPNTILDADCIISIAKLKVHRKCGVTLALKNLVGTTNEKRWLPHHRAGTPSVGGDMCPDDAPRDRKLNEFLADRVSSHRYGYHFRRFVLPTATRVWKALRLKSLLRLGQTGAHDYREGDWHGNDTIWRTVLDLNVALTYADRAGRLQPTPQRTRFNVIDGIIGGDREGPLHPRPRACGVICMGSDPVAVDVVSSALMGFDPSRLQVLSASTRTTRPIGINVFSQISVVSNDPRFSTWRTREWPHFGFEPPRGWVGHIELTPRSAFYT